MAFFSKDFHNFFKKLDTNNNRPWFNEHKEDYIKHVKEPFEEFVAALILGAGKIDPEIQILPKAAMFRIYRDVRFSKNKTPYKTNMSASISKYGRKKMNHPGIYVQVGVDGLMMASGIYSPKPDIRDQIRTHILENPKEFKKILSKKSFIETWGELQGDKNKILPAEFKEAAKTQPLLANKQFYVMKRITDPKVLTDPDLDKIIFKHLKEAMPLAEFLKSALV